MTKFQEKILALDLLLTGQEQDYAQKCTERYCPISAAVWLQSLQSGVYYLSDGGISRVGFYKNHLYLTPNSSREALAAWDNALDARKQIEQMFAEVEKPNAQ